MQQQPSEELGQEFELVDAVLPLPGSPEELVERVLFLFSASHVESVEIRGSGIRLKRWMPKGLSAASVIPDWTPPSSLDPKALLERVSMEELGLSEWKQHPHLQIMAATRRLESHGTFPVAIIAPQGPAMALWLGSNTDIGEHFLGCRVLRADYPNRLAVLGAPQPPGRHPRLSDATHGVIIDMED